MNNTLVGARLIRDLTHRFDIVNDDVRVGNRDVNIIRPRSADELINEMDFERDERLPYWAELWPSSTILANFVLRHPRPGARLIELGAGIGLVSIAAAIAGYDVTASDYYEDALAFARANSFRNLGYEIATALIDWRSIPADVPQFDVVLASDVLYESRYAPLVAGVIDRLLSPAGVAYLADPGRVAAVAFTDACAERKLHIHARTSQPYQAGAIRQSITVYELSRPE